MTSREFITNALKTESNDFTEIAKRLSDPSRIRSISIHNRSDWSKYDSCATYRVSAATRKISKRRMEQRALRAFKS